MQDQPRSCHGRTIGLTRLDVEERVGRCARVPTRKWRSFEKSKRRVRLFGRLVGPIPRGHALAIEIDGPHHEGNRDSERDAYLREHHNVYVVRFDASEIEALM